MLAACIIYSVSDFICGVVLVSSVRQLQQNIVHEARLNPTYLLLKSRGHVVTKDRSIEDREIDIPIMDSGIKRLDFDRAYIEL